MKFNPNQRKLTEYGLAGALIIAAKAMSAAKPYYVSIALSKVPKIVPVPYLLP